MADAVSQRPWSEIHESDYADAADFCRASLIDLNPKGAPKVKARCKLPVLEPRSMGGRLNRNGVHAAAARIDQVDAPAAAIAKAAEALRAIYRQLGEEPPASVRRPAQ